MVGNCCRAAQIVLHCRGMPLSGECHCVGREELQEPARQSQRAQGTVREALVETRVDFRGRMPLRAVREPADDTIHAMMILPFHPKPPKVPARGWPHPASRQILTLLLGLVPRPPPLPFFSHLQRLRDAASGGPAPPGPAAAPLVYMAGSFCLDWPALLRARPGPAVPQSSGDHGSLPGYRPIRWEQCAVSNRVETNAGDSAQPASPPVAIAGASPGAEPMCQRSQSGSPDFVVPNSPEEEGDGYCGCPPNSIGGPGRSPGPPADTKPHCSTPSARPHDPSAGANIRQFELPWEQLGTNTLPGPPRSSSQQKEAFVKPSFAADGTNSKASSVQWGTGMGSGAQFPQSSQWLVHMGPSEPRGQSGLQALAQGLADVLGVSCEPGPLPGALPAPGPS